jgi:hypothetical protein
MECSSTNHPHLLSFTAAIAWLKSMKTIGVGCLEGEIWTTDSEVRVYTSRRHQVCLQQPTATIQVPVSLFELSHSLHISLFFFLTFQFPSCYQFTIVWNVTTVTQRDMWKEQSWMLLNTSTVITTCVNSLHVKSSVFHPYSEFNLQFEHQNSQLFWQYTAFTDRYSNFSIL